MFILSYHFTCFFFQLCKESSAEQALKHVVDSASVLISSDNVTNNTKDERSLQESDYGRISKYLVAHCDNSSPNFKGNFGYFLQPVIDRITYGEFNELLASELNGLPYIHRRSKKKSFGGKAIDASQAFLEFLQHCFSSSGDLSSLLLLIKRILCFLDTGESILVGHPVIAEMELSRNAILSFADLLCINEQEKYVQHLRNFESIPRILLSNGIPGKFTTYEVQGKCVGFIGSIAMENIVDDVYFEVVMKGKNFSGVRVGLGIVGSDFSGALPGDDKNAWTIELSSLDYFYNSKSIASERSQTEQINTGISCEKDNSDEDGDYLSNLFEQRFFEEDFSEKGDEADPNQTDNAPDVIVSDSTDLNNLKTGVSKDDNKSIILSEMLEKRLSKELPKSTMQQGSSFRLGGTKITEENFDVSAGSVLGVLFNGKTRKISFYLNGKLIGCGLDEIPEQAVLSPVFSCNATAGLEFNIGQTDYIFAGKVSELIEKAKINVLDYSCNTFIEISQKSLVSHPHLLHITNFAVDSYKAMTFEIGTAFEYFKLEPGVEGDEESLTLLTVSPGLNSDEEGGCSMGIDSTGAMFFQLNGAERIVSPKAILKPSQWYQLDFLYTFHRSSNKASVGMLVNGVNVYQQDIMSSKRQKVVKLIPRNLFLVSKPLSSHGQWTLKLADLRVWSTTRSVERILSTLGRSKISGVEVDLLGFLPFEEVNGTNLHDLNLSRNTVRQRKYIKLLGSIEWKQFDKQNTYGLKGCLRWGSERDFKYKSLLKSMGSMGEKLSEMVSISDILLEIATKILVSCENYVECPKHVCHAKKIADFLPGIKLMVNPSQLNLNLLYSTSMQAKEQYMLRKGNEDILLVLILGLSNLLSANLAAIIDDCEINSSDTFNRLSGYNMVTLANKVFMVLLNFMSLTPFSDSQKILIDEVEQTCCKAICSGLAILMPDKSNQFFFLEALIISQYADLYSFPGRNIFMDTLNIKRELDTGEKKNEKDPLKVLFSLHAAKRVMLTNALCKHFACQNLIDFIIPEKHLPLLDCNSLKEFIPVADQEILPKLGDTVGRGTHWKYLNEDGGVGSKGLVIGISPWVSGGSGHSLKVAWRNGSTNYYRWAVEEHNLDGAIDRCYDVQLYCLPNDKRSDRSVPVIADPHEKNSPKHSQSAWKAPDHLRKALSYSPMDVRKALLEDRGQVSLTKRSVLLYMKEVASVEWLERKKLSRPINLLLSRLNGQEVTDLYYSFFEAFSIGDDVRNNVGPNPLAIELRTRVSLTEADQHNRLILLFKGLLYFVVDQATSVKQAGVSQLLVTIFYLLYGADSPKSGLQCKISNADFWDQNCVFQSSSGGERKWKWDEGLWMAIESNTLGKSAGNTSTNQAETAEYSTLTDLSIDESYLGGNMIIKKRSRGVEIMQSGERDWNTCICSTMLSPNTGTYKWHIRIKNYSERRGQCMFGVATSEFSCDEFLGQDQESWGMSPNLDLFHNGRKRRSDTDSKIPIGGIVEITLDTDQGSLLFREVSSDGEINSEPVGFQNLKGIVVAPAFSLYSPGDCIAIMNSIEEINSLNKNYLIKTDSTTAKRSKTIFGPCGAPSALAVQYILVLIDQTITQPGNSLSYLCGMLTFSLSKLFLWSEVPDDAKPLFDALNLLLNFLKKKLINIVDGTAGHFAQLNCIAALLVSKIVAHWIESDNCLVDNRILAVEVRQATEVEKSTIDGGFEMIDCHKNILFSQGIRCSIELPEKMLLSIIESHANVELLLQWVSVHDRTHKNYKRFGGDTLAKPVRMVFAVGLYHCGASSMLHHVNSFLLEKVTKSEDAGQALRATKLPQIFSQCWEMAMKLRLWAKELVSTGLSYDFLAERISARSKFLFEMEPCLPEKSIVNFEDTDNLLVESKLLQSDKKSSTVISEVKRFVTDNVSIARLRAIFKTGEQTSELRKFGYKAVRSLIDNFSDFKGISYKAALLEGFGKALKGRYLSVKDTKEDIVDDYLGHYLSCTYGLSKIKRMELQGAFDLLYSCLTQELSSASSNDEKILQLSIMNCLGVRIVEDDHTMLSRIGFFFTLQEVLENSFNGYNQKSDALHGSTVAKSAMKLFILIALQVATLRDKDSGGSDSSMPHSLKKVKSGPATLSKAVFDILYTQLDEVLKYIENAKLDLSDNNRIIKISQNYNLLITESTALLTTVSKDASCRFMLMKEKWIKLLLSMAISSTPLCQQRALQILSDILPAMALSDLDEFDGDLHSCLCTAYNLDCPCGEAIVTVLLQFVGSCILDVGDQLSVIVDGDLTTSMDVLLAPVSEAICLLRMLHCLKWSVLTSRIFLETLTVHVIRDEKQQRMVLGVLSVLGGHIDMPYESSTVIYQDASTKQWCLGIVDDATSLDKVKIIPVVKDIYACDEMANGSISISTGIALSLEKIQAVNRYPFERLHWSEELISCVTGTFYELILERLDIKNFSSGSALASEEEEKAYDKNIKILKNYSARLLTRLAQNSSTCSYIYKSFMDRMFFAEKLLSCAQTTSSSGGLLDLEVLEEYIALLLHNRRILIAAGNRSLLNSSDSTQVEASGKQSTSISNTEGVIPPATLSIEQTDQEYVIADLDGDEEGKRAILVESLATMGFPMRWCEIAMEMCHGDPEEALHYILTHGFQLEEMAKTTGNERPSSAVDILSGRSAEIVQINVPEPTVFEEPQIYHYDGEATKLLGLFSEPSFQSERLLCIYPSDDFSALAIVPDDDAQNCWYKLRYADFDEAHYIEPVLDLENKHVWVPHVYNGKVMIFPGSYEGDAEGILGNPPGDAIAIDRTYCIIGANGALVRESSEINSPEVCSIKQGDIVHASEETFNSEGTLRLRLDRPVVGWISKLSGLVKLVEPPAGSLPAESATTPDVNELEQLEELDDSMELTSGYEAYSKDDRFFGSLQGNQYVKFKDTANNVAQVINHRRVRISGTGSFQQCLQNLSTKSISSIDKAIGEVSVLMSMLYSRKILLCLIFLDIRMSDSQHLHSSYRFLQMLIDNRPIKGATAFDCFPDSKRWFEEETIQTTTLKMANSFFRFIRLLSFRGEPCSILGLESLALSDVTSTGLITTTMTVEEQLDAIVKFIVLSVHNEADSVNFSFYFTALMLEAVAKNIRLACSSKYADHLWADSSYEEDTDADTFEQPNIHFACWMTRSLFISHNVSTIMYLIRCWVNALKSTSLSLKHCAFVMLAEILDYCTNNSILLNTELVLQILPVDRLISLGEKRLWLELEDYPLYSRFLQALLHLLSVIQEYSDLRDRKHETLTSESIADNSLHYEPVNDVRSDRAIALVQRPMVTMNANSYIQFSPQKDIPGPWTIEFWLYRRKLDYPSVDPRPEKEQLQRQTEKKGLSGLIDMMIKAGVKQSEKQISKYHAPVEYLLRSGKSQIKLQKGGRLFLTDPNFVDTLQEIDPVNDEALCVSMSSSSEKTFNCVVPFDKWTHLTISCQISPSSLMTIFIDGVAQDAVAHAMNLPLGMIGSNSAGQSFSGELAEMRVWSSARTQSEIMRDMIRDVDGSMHLVTHLKFMKDFSSKLLHDEAGGVNTCKLMNCTWTMGYGPSPKRIDVPLFMLRDFNEVDMEDSKTHRLHEFTGLVTINSIRGAQSDLSTKISEIMTVCFRYKNENDENIEGYLWWNERNVRLQLKGILQRDGKLIFEVSKDSILLGPQESVSWLDTLKFTGEFSREKITGAIFLDCLVEGPSPVSAGETRVDILTLHREIFHSILPDGRERLTLNSTCDEGQYVAFVDISNYEEKSSDTNSDTSSKDMEVFGLVASEGSAWIEWEVKNNSGNIIFGVATSQALVHPDSCVEANDGTWAYSISGQGSHGFDLRICDAAEENDKIGIQINTDKNGSIIFYKNADILIEFENFGDYLEAQQTENTVPGVRPFVSLASPQDMVVYLGQKKGSVSINYQENDSDQRRSFCGTVDRGAINGYGATLYRDEQKWFGKYKKNCSIGTHVEVTSMVEGQKVKFRKYNDDGVVENSGEMLPADEPSLIQVVDAYKQFSSKIDSATESKDLINVSDLPSPPPSQKLTFIVRDSIGEDSIFKTNFTTLCSQVIEAYAHKRELDKFSFRLFYNDELMLSERSVGSYSIREGSVLVVKVNSLVEPNDHDLKNYLDSSTAPMVVKVIYESGATVRNGVEIEESMAIRTLKSGEVVEAFQRSFTSENIGRYKIADGWISEKLRGGTEAKVIQVLQERLPCPILYEVVRSDGARIRESHLMDSSDVGFCPQGTAVKTSLKRYIPSEDASDSGWCCRIFIEEPVEWLGWASVKDHILRQVPNEDGSLDNSIVTAVDPELVTEMHRRSKVRSSRKAKAEMQAIVSKMRRKWRFPIPTTGTLTASEETLFLLRPPKTGSGLTLSPDFTTVTCNDSSSGRSLVLGSRGFRSGVHYWEVKVEGANWGSVFIGVAPDETTSWTGYGLLNYRATQAFGCETLYGSYFSVNDKVGVLLDMDHGTISFFKDGEDFNVGKVNVVNMGVAYHNMRRNSRAASPIFYPCLGLKSNGDQLSIRHCQWISSRGCNTASMLSKVLDSKRLLKNWRQSYTIQNDLPAGMIDKTFDIFKKWQQRDVVQIRSRPGIQVLLDRSLEAIRLAAGKVAAEYDLYARKPITTVYGPGMIVGARGNQLWYVYEGGEDIAWYWTEDTLMEQLNLGLLQISTNETRDEGRNESLVCVPVSFDEFSSSVRGVKWTLEEDAAIVTVVNSLAHKSDTDPLLISTTNFIAAVKNINVLKDKTDLQLQSRYCALCLVNQAASVVTPLSDYIVGDNTSSAILTSYSKFNFTNKCLSGDGSSSNSSSCLISLKRILFTRIKMSYWEDLIRETTTPTMAPADEYEKPDDLREITINRVESRNSEKVKDSIPFSSRVKISVFGQLMENMIHWDERSFRRAFIHMQDAGQARAFFVKFVGEGVDDQGGPYRAVFQTAVGEEPVSMIDLLSPCANAGTEIGDNREKYLLNFSLLNNQENAKLFIHLGRLIGMAKRHSILVPFPVSQIVWKALCSEPVGPEDIYAIDTATANSLRALTTTVGISSTQMKELLIQALVSQAYSPSFRHFVNSQIAEQLVNQAVGFASETQKIDVITEDISQQSIGELVDLIQHIYLQSQSECVKLLYRGLNQVVPVEPLALFTSEELERMFCGEPEVDIDVLKKATVYDGVSSDDP